MQTLTINIAKDDEDADGFVVFVWLRKDTTHDVGDEELLMSEVVDTIEEGYAEAIKVLARLND